MAYKRIVSPTSLLEGDPLTAAMVGIGMNFSAEAMKEPNIEDTLLAASMEGMEHDDLRVLAILVTWIGIHHSWINADRLFRAVQAMKKPRVCAFWAAMGFWLRKDQRFKRFTGLYQNAPINLLGVGTEFQLARRGGDPRFENSPLRVPTGVLRDRSADVLQPVELAKCHSAYRYRVQMGPTYRADMWAMLDQFPTLAPATLARRTYGSFATAWQVKQDWRLLTDGSVFPRFESLPPNP